MQPSEEIRAAVVLDVFRAANLLSRVGGKLAVQAGLSSVSQWLLLGTVAAQPGVALRDLRQNTLVTKQNISSMVERLKQAGYLETYTDRADRRVVRVRITEEGRCALAVLQPLTKESNEATFKGFSQDELRLFSGLLRRLLSALGECADGGRA